MKRYHIYCLLIGVASLTSSESCLAEVIRCEDASGNVIFTDSDALCAQGTRESVEIDTFDPLTSTATATPDSATSPVVAGNTEPSNDAEPDARRGFNVNYREPERQYTKARGPWEIYVERELFANNSDLARRAIRKLQRNLDAVFSELPWEPGRRLKRLSFYLMQGDEPSQGHRFTGLYYVRDGAAGRNPLLDPRWGHSIIVHNAADFVALDRRWTRKALAHEIAHGWHLSNWSADYPAIVEAYDNARRDGLYQDIEGYNGRLVADAYALNDPKEYFAELSAIYFVDGVYFPFNRKGLAKYDPTGYAMVSAMWQEPQ